MKKLFVLIVTTLIMVQLFSQKTTIYPTYPGTSVRDYSKPAIVIEKNKIYNTYPGTSVRDYSKPSYTIEREKLFKDLYNPKQVARGTQIITVYPDLPYLDIKDFTKAGFKVEHQDKYQDVLDTGELPFK